MESKRRQRRQRGKLKERIRKEHDSQIKEAKRRGRAMEEFISTSQKQGFYK